MFFKRIVILRGDEVQIILDLLSSTLHPKVHCSRTRRTTLSREIDATRARVTRSKGDHKERVLLVTTNEDDSPDKYRNEDDPDILDGKGDNMPEAKNKDT